MSKEKPSPSPLFGFAVFGLSFGMAIAILIGALALLCIFLGSLLGVI